MSNRFWRWNRVWCKLDWTEGRPTRREWTTTDGRLNRGFRWTSLEHMNDTTNDLAALTQRWCRVWPCSKSNERQMDFPNQLQIMNRGCHVQERRLLPPIQIPKHIPFPKFPHHFWRVPLYFYASLRRITYACWCKLILWTSPSEYFLINPKKEWFGPVRVFRCLFNESKERNLGFFHV